MEKWKEAQTWEREWHGNCVNTYGEEEKQLLYASRMGLPSHHNGKSPYNFNMGAISIMDIGGGPTSLLLKTSCAQATVIEPMEMPDWVYDRYEAAGIDCVELPGEEVGFEDFDECWIYNVLQHTQDPALVIERAKQAGKLIRIFEWIDTVSNVGHPHILTEEKLNKWLGGEGKVEQLNGQANCYGSCFYGIFPT